MSGLSSPGKTRQFPFLAVTTLSIAAACVTAPAWAPAALASAEHATAGDAAASGPPATAPAVREAPAAPAAPAVPAAGSAIAGYVLAGDGSGYYTYDSADAGSGAVTVTSIGTGIFKVSFAKLSGIADSAAAQVTAFNAADSCVLNITRPAGSDLTDIVQCTRIATGNPDGDAEFDLVVTRPAHPVHGKASPRA